MGKKKKTLKQSKSSPVEDVGDQIKPDSNGTGEEEHLKYSVDDLLHRISEYVENYEYELAMKFCEKAFKIAPENTRVLETCGNVCAEVGDVDNAREYFLKAVQLEPTSGHVKYLYLGQLSEGHDAIENYEKAIKLMKDALDFEKNNLNSSISNLNQVSVRDISNVFCSIAEIFMTDCCMEDGAEALCEKNCKLAVETDGNNTEAYIAMCNLLLSKNDMNSAKLTVEKAFELWQKTSENEVENIPEIIPYESRITLIKILIEVEYYDKVSLIVDQLIEENEDDVRIWYYLGLSKSLLEDHVENPRFYIEKALELYEKTGCEDGEMKDHLEELLGGCPVEENMDTIREDDEDEDEDSHEEKMEDD